MPIPLKPSSPQPPPPPRMTYYECGRCGEKHEGLSVDDWMNRPLLEILTDKGPFPMHAGDTIRQPSPTYHEPEAH